ncbi:pentapeptide repeat-containing protein [Streptomyces sp. NBC_00882]|uniref:pentapeptide repeat-containing protein n=1 Tax=Streptomyces sp. NBC_00882 TaxID=2975856 RepID=UPI00386726E5|nr:pentapeptide repeat-containing protein [Streptomyces sp. NBC_00882]
MTTPSPPSWPHCGNGADPSTDPIGCRGIHVPGHTACLAHLTDTDRTAYLTGLAPGADVDHRGTPFTQDLLQALLHALTDATTSTPHLGCAEFSDARFTGSASFRDAQFTGDAHFVEARFDIAEFQRAQFTGRADFTGAHFTSHAGFGEVQFTRTAVFLWVTFDQGALFNRARFRDQALFTEVHFAGHAGFIEVQFTRSASFTGAHFVGNVSLTGAQCTDDVSFAQARFEGPSLLGPLVCAQNVVLSGAVFMLPATVEIAAREVKCQRTRWESTATVRVRHAAVDLSHAVLTAPAAVLTHPSPFTYPSLFIAGDATLREDIVASPGASEPVRIVSVQGADAAHLVLTDTDLTDCLFSGAFHLDQIRLEGRTTFADAPTGWHLRGALPVHFTPRRILAEEHHWRAHTAGSATHGWRPGPHHSDPARTPDPEDVAALYRQLRKAFEDGKNEPGAADFYYGECEMRRHAPATPDGERRLLWGYWLLSGYGLRASRAFTWLLAAMSLTVLLLMGFGLPIHDPDPATTGTMTGSKISLHTSTPDPALHGGWSQRMTWARTEKATRVAINSVIFRSSGQNLTTPGTEMASRLFEPILLALGILAIRGRIKR